MKRFASKSARAIRLGARRGRLGARFGQLGSRFGRLGARFGRLAGLLLGLTLSFPGVQAQSASSFDELGRFYVKSFGPEVYQAHAQNWAIVQSPDGLLYVGNGDGVLEYDGVSWRLIETQNRSVVRSLAVDERGRVFVGASGELGYLAPDALGGASYVSLRQRLPAAEREFADVWQTHVLDGSVYFGTRARLFRWPTDDLEHGEVTVWTAATGFFAVSVVHDTLVLREKGRGLVRLEGGSLRLAPGGEAFAKTRVFALVPHGSDAYLVLTRSEGLFRCPIDGGPDSTCAPFAPDATDLLAASQPYHATGLPGGMVAVGTLRGGVILLDPDGRVLRVLDEATGLPDKTVWRTYPDRQGGLWLGSDNGLARVEVASPLSFHDKTTGLAGTVSSVARHRDHLYAATTLGVYRLRRAAAGAPARFEPVPGVAAQCWALLSVDETLLAACFGGLYDPEARRLLWDSAAGHVFSVYRSVRDPDLIYLGLEDGLVRLRRDAGQWQAAGRVDGVREQVRSMVEDAQGRLWIGTRKAGALRLAAATAAGDDPAARDPGVRRFGVAEGLPGGWINVTSVAGQVRFWAEGEAGLFRMGTGAGASGFGPDTTFDTFLPQGSRGIENLTEGDQGRVWIAAGTASGVAHPAADGGYTWTPTALRRAATKGVYALHFEADGVLWAGGPHGLVRYDTHRSLEPSGYRVWIRRLTASGSLLFDGQTARPLEAPVWPYRYNALRFAFAAPRYDASENTHYRSRLDGFERAGTGEDWSAWSPETDKDYTNLWEGRYVFRVQARDVYGRLSREDVFAFRILPPWYRAWWAWTLYGLIAVGSIWGGYRLRTRSLRRRNAELELRVRDRTVELEAKADELAAKNDELERFAYTVSHDLKSPLVTIQGFLGFLERDVAAAATDPGADERVAGDVGRIRGAANKMQRLIDDLLELSRVGREAGRPEVVEMVEVSREVRELLIGPIAERGVEVVVARDLPAVRGDRTQLHQLLQNLIQNALQYMGDQPSPRIEVGVRGADVKDGESPAFYVRDNGMGIDPRYHEKVFGLFERLDPGASERTGIGLALVKRIVEVHGGRIWVESEGAGRGSTFCFTLPGWRPATTPAKAAD